MKYTIRKHKSVLISKNLVLWSLLIHPFLKPNGIHGINSLIDNLYDAGIVISLSFVLIFFIRMKKHINANIVLTTGFIGWITVVTVFSNGQVTTVLRMSAQYIGLVLTVVILSEKPIILIESMLLNLEILIYINFICLLIYPHGMYVSKQNGNWNNWLLGYDNQWFIVFFGAMFVALSFWNLTQKFFRPLLLITIIHVSTAFVLSGVLIFGLAIIDFFILSKIYKTEILTYRRIWLIAIVANIVIIFFSASGLSTFIIYTVFHKTATSIPARLKMWKISFDAIRKNSIIGYGHQQTLLRTTMYHNLHGSNAHNFFIEILYEGGIIGMGLFICLCVASDIMIKKTAPNDMRGILFSCMTACLVTGSVDSLLESRGALFFWMLAIAYNLPLINNRLYLKQKE